MLKWENLVIEHEKMQKLREDIQGQLTECRQKLGHIGEAS
jgi:hypothetical protein